MKNRNPHIGYVMIMVMFLLSGCSMNKVEVVKRSGPCPREDSVDKFMKYSFAIKECGVIQNNQGDTYGLSYRDITFSKKKMDEIFVGNRKEITYKNHKVKVIYNLYNDVQRKETSTDKIEMKDR